MNKIHQGYLYQLYGGMIYKKECNLPKALELWDQMTKLYPYEWAAWFSRGDYMVRMQLQVVFWIKKLLIKLKNYSEQID